MLTPSNTWNIVVGGLEVLGSISECLNEEPFEEHFQDIMISLLPLFNTENFRIGYSLLKTLALLCLEYTPIIQISFHPEILGFIIKQINAGASGKIKGRAVSAVLNFCSGSEHSFP
jgi:hypothetical protein